MKGKKRKFVRINLLVEIFLFVCVFFWNKKYVSSYTFELCRRVGDRNILNGRFPETRLLFFGLKGFQSWKRVLDIIQKRFQKSFPRMNLKPSSKLWNNWICFLPICLTWDHSQPQFWFNFDVFFFMKTSTLKPKEVSKIIYGINLNKPETAGRI